MYKDDTFTIIFTILSLLSKRIHITIYRISHFSKSHDEEKLSQFLETLMSDGTVLDGTVSESPSRQSSQIWELRERIAEALKKDGYTYKYDISLPLDTFYDR